MERLRRGGYIVRQWIGEKRKVETWLEK